MNEIWSSVVGHRLEEDEVRRTRSRQLNTLWTVDKWESRPTGPAPFLSQQDAGALPERTPPSSAILKITCQPERHPPRFMHNINTVPRDLAQV